MRTPSRTADRWLRQLECCFDQCAQLLQRDRLGQIIESAGLEYGNRIFHVAVRGDHRDRHIRMMRGDMPHHLQPVAVRQTHIGQAQIVWFAVQLLQRFMHIGGALNL